jgi:hypothetical protein
MTLLGKLTAAERDMLTGHIIVGLQQTVAELDCLTRCPPYLRDQLYGPRALEAFTGTRDDLISLLQEDVT